MLGKKAENLIRLRDAGFPVPRFFVIAPEEHLHATTLVERIEAMGGFPVSVRSSGRLEDLAHASFAGQYKTFLDVADQESLMARIQECRDSAQDAHVRQYLMDRGLDPAQAQVAVVIQRMVHPLVAGVAFTMHPTRAREGAALVEAISGLGEDLVSGRVVPTTYEFDLSHPGEYSRVGGEDYLLTPSQASKLAHVMIAVQKHYGRPQDLEWAIDGAGKLWLLQARDITALRFEPTPSVLALKDPVLADRVYAPLASDLISQALHAVLDELFAELGLERRAPLVEERFFRFYLNWSELERLISAVPGVSAASLAQALGVPLGSRSGVGSSAAPTAKPWSRVWRLARYIARHAVSVRRRRRALRAPGTDLLGLVAYHQELRKLYLKTIVVNALTQGLYRKAFAWVPSVAFQSADLPHARLARAIGELATGGERAFFAEFGHHADHELDWFCPRWSEQPHEVLPRLLAQSTRLTAAPSARASWIARRLAAPGRRLMAEKEILKDEVTKSVASIRRELARALPRDPELLLFLRSHELVRYRTTREARILTLAESRRQQSLGYRHWEAPRVLMDREAFEPSPSVSSGVLAGLGATAGVVEGPVRVLESLEEMGHLQPGEILVTRFTDPAWTAILGMTIGLITEHGGMLSHAAIISREYGIPAVLGVADATRRLSTGDRVRIMGDQGKVEILETA